MIHLICIRIGHNQEMCRKYHLCISAECILSVLCAGNVSDTPNFLCTGNVPEMSCVLAIGNVPEMSCVLQLAIGNDPEILPYTVPENVKEMSKFPGLGNVHIMSRKCELSCTFHGISWPRKFRISSSVWQIF